MKSREEVVEEMQKVVAQMKIDDINDNPDSENEYFQCAIVTTQIWLSAIRVSLVV